jgi:S-formylglutathione hydrolase FrmB
MAPATAAEIPDAVFNAARGCWQIQLPSEYQAGPARVEILRPDHLEPGKQYPVLFVLPVETGQGARFGDGLIEAKKADLANKYGLICVCPSFTALPWYGNHTSDPHLQQEKFVLQTLLPYIESHEPVRRDKEGRWLLGFSKSGWGAFTLLLRHPDVFGYASAWDTPFMLNGENSGQDWGPLGIHAVFGTKEAFQQFLPSRLAAEKAGAFKGRTRLVLGIGAEWQKQVEEMHALLDQVGVPHAYRADLNLPHRWDSGWFAPMTENLVRLARAGSH